MTENQHKINQLFSAVERLLKKQESIANDITLLRNEIQKVQDAEPKVDAVKENSSKEEATTPPIFETVKEAEVVSPTPVAKDSFEEQKIEHTPKPTATPATRKKPKTKNELEKFIG